MDKREFIKSSGIASIGLATGFKDLSRLVETLSPMTSLQVAHNEPFWAGIRAGYRLKPDYINLENGYYCISPQEILESFIQHAREINYQGSYYMRTVQWDNKREICARSSAF